MDAAQKDRLVEEAKQRSFQDILAKAHQGTNTTDAVTLRDEVMKVGIAEAATLRGLVDHIFNRALEDISTSATLADFCQLMPAHLEPAEAPAPKEKGAGSRNASEKRIDFRLMLIKKIKEELEKGAMALKAVKQWEAKESEQKGKLKGEDEKNAAADRAAYARSLTAIQFTCYLYNAGIATDKIMHSIIDNLLRDEIDPRHEDVDLLCELLKRCGAKIDASTKTTKDTKVLADYYRRIQKMKDEAVSKNIAKALDSVLTLKSKGWEA